MISVERVFNAIKDITVSQLPLSEKPDVILEAIDLGVIELAKRFNLFIDVEQIVTSKDLFVYEVVNNNITQILSIEKSNGVLLQQNKIINTDYDYKLLSYRKFILKNPDNESILVVFKTNPPTQIKSKEDIIDIPLDFIGALIDYATYRCHITLNNDNLKEVDTHFRRFELTCQELSKTGYKQEIFSSWKGGNI